MKLGGIDIITPADDAILYDLDWRSMVAQAAADNGVARLPVAVRKDGDIKALLACLKRAANMSESCLAATSIRRSSLRPVAEAMLLTDAGNAQIAAATGFDPEAVRFYEALFFNVRDKNGVPKPSQLMRMATDIESHDEPAGAQEKFTHALATAALRGGYPMVASLLPDPHPANGSRPLSRMVEAELHRRLLRGELSTSALLRMRDLDIAEARMKHDTGQDDDDGYKAQYIKLMQFILGQMKPKMADSSSDIPQEPAQAKPGVSISEAEANIAKVQVQEYQIRKNEELQPFIRQKFADVMKPARDPLTEC